MMKWNTTRVSDLFILHVDEESNQSTPNETSTEEEETSGNNNNNNSIENSQEKSTDEVKSTNPETRLEVILNNEISIDELEERLQNLMKEEEALIVALHESGKTREDLLGLNKKEKEILEKLKENIPLEEILTMNDDSDASYDESYDSDLEVSERLAIEGSLPPKILEEIKLINEVAVGAEGKKGSNIPVATPTSTPAVTTTTTMKQSLSFNFHEKLINKRWNKVKLEKMPKEELINHALTLQWMIDNKDSLLLQYRQREQLLKEEIIALCKKHNDIPSFGFSAVGEEAEDDIEEKLDNFFLTDNLLHESLEEVKKNEQLKSSFGPINSDSKPNLDGKKTAYHYAMPTLIQNTIGYYIENGDKLPSASTNFLAQNDYFYLEHFSGREHINLVSNHSDLGITVISISKEDPNGQFHVLTRTKKCDEYHLVPKSRIEKSGLKSITRKILRAISPTFGSLKYNTVNDNSFKNELIQFENRTVTKKFKIGVLLCKDNQRKEEEMFGNEVGSSYYDEFLNFLGEKIPLSGWQQFAGGLDTKTGTTGTHSIFTDWNGCQIMYHVSTLLPFSPADPQQVERKRHIGNDIVLIVFLDSSTPYKPTTISSNFIHVTIVIQVYEVNEDGTTHTYKMWVVSKDSVAAFDPQLPTNPIFVKTKKFHTFLMTKIVNAELSCYRSERFSKKLEHARETYLKSISAPYMK